MRYISPLRYPGGKSKLSNYIKLLIKMNLLYDGYYVEPYVGGASIGLELLINEYVRKIFINDIDYAIFSFWYTVLNNPDYILNKITKVKITIEEWKKQKQIYDNYHDFDINEVGFATFFLNRTNISGILTGGFIGGYNQSSKWGISARFNKDELKKRIKLISYYSDRIELFNLDALLFLNKINSKINKETFFYLDPPYYKKGKDLYLNFYNSDDHKSISLFIKKYFYNKNWVLTYDNVNEITDLYFDFRSIQYNINYSANKNKLGEEVMFFSDTLNIPTNLIPSDTKNVKNILLNKKYY